MVVAIPCGEGAPTVTNSADDTMTKMLEKVALLCDIADAAENFMSRTSIDRYDRLRVLLDKWNEVK
jgi:hypothetical protein